MEINDIISEVNSYNKSFDEMFWKPLWNDKDQQTG